MSLIEIESGTNGNIIETNNSCQKTFNDKCFSQLKRKVLKHYKINDECQEDQENTQKQFICICLHGLNNIYEKIKIEPENLALYINQLAEGIQNEDEEMDIEYLRRII